MEYKRFGDTYAIRLDRGDEIIASIAALCEKENVELGHVYGLGAVYYAVTGLYEMANQSFHKSTFEGEAEIVSLAGNVSRKDGKIYLHFHIALADAEGTVRGGHLSEARISATAEIYLTRLAGAVGRKRDDATGLNLMDFS